MSEFASSLVQGLIQGLTEYLPVSSSAHLAIFQNVTGTPAAGIAFDLLLHVATVAATVVYFARDIVALTCEFFSGFRQPADKKPEGWYFGWAVIFGSVPTAVVGLMLEPYVEHCSQSMGFVGSALIVTSLMLFGLSFLRPGTKKICISIGLIVGLAQGLAVFPGISRSGTTIAFGLLCGLSAAEAFRFSFLLSLPAIVGAALLEARHVSGALASGWHVAMAVAFLSGLGALYLLRRVALGGRWRVFAVYCAAVGLLAILYLG